MITKYERTVLDLAAALAAQLIKEEKHYDQGAKHGSDEGTDLRLLREAQHARKEGIIRSIRELHRRTA